MIEGSDVMQPHNYCTQVEFGGYGYFYWII